MFKKATAALLAVILLALLLVSCGKSDVPPGMKLASKPETDGMTLYIPEEYTVTRDRITGVISAQISKLDPTSIVAYMAHPSEASIEEYFEAKLDPAALGEDFAIEKDYPKTQKVAGRDAKVYVFTFKRGGVNYRTMQVYVPVGATPAEGVAILSYTGKTDPTVTGTVLYTKNLEGFDKVLQVFQLKAPTPAVPPTAPNAGMQLASDPEKVDYYFYVPGAWVLDPIAEGMPSAYLSSDKTTVSVVRYYPENVQTVADYVAKVIKDYEKLYDSFTPPETVEKDGKSVLSYETLAVAGFPAYRYEFAGELDGIAYRFTQVYILRNKGLTQGLYTVTLTASGASASIAAERFAARQDDLAAMLDAFRFD